MKVFKIEIISFEFIEKPAQTYPSFMPVLLYTCNVQAAQQCEQFMGSIVPKVSVFAWLDSHAISTTFTYIFLQLLQPNTRKDPFCKWRQRCLDLCLWDDRRLWPLFGQLHRRRLVCRGTKIALLAPLCCATSQEPLYHCRVFRGLHEHPLA